MELPQKLVIPNTAKIAFVFQLQHVSKQMVQTQTLPHVYVVHQLVHPVQVYFVKIRHAAAATIAQTLTDRQQMWHVHVVKLLPAMIIMEIFAIIVLALPLVSMRKQFHVVTQQLKVTSATV